MRLGVTLFLLSFTITASASTKSFHVETEISIDGQTIAKPNFLTLPGRISTLTDLADKRIERVEMLALDDAHTANSNAIMMRFKVSLNVNGEKKTHEPTIIARSGSPAELAVGDSHGRELFRIKVVAHRDLE